jgi:multidrug resistance efflux pump
VPWMDGKRTLGRIALVGALLGVELYLARDLTSSAGVPGYTATNSYSIAPPRPATIKSISVELGATVHAGDVIAQLESIELDTELEVANASRTSAAAEIVAEAARLRRDSVNLKRRFASGSEQANAQLASAEAEAHTAAAELAAIDAELVQQTDLVAKKLANAAVLSDLQLRRAALAKQVDAASSVLRVLRGNLSSATQRSVALTSGDASSDDDQLKGLQAKLQAADVVIAQLTRERERMTVRAPADGVIDSLPLQPGAMASPELPVATLVAPDAQRVVACIPEARARGIEVGLEADITSTYDKTTSTGAIESVTGTIGPLPLRCQNPATRVIAMGRVAIVALDEPMGGLPGQTQIIKISARRRPPATRTPPAPQSTGPRGSGAPPVVVTAPPAPAAPAALQVPSELLARTRFEPSGLVWVAALDRYVVVSDDTGTNKQDEHVPWLFTMSAAGAIDPLPLVVTGVDELNDIESITTDGAGGLWLMSSQSQSKKGKRPVSRRQLVHVTFTKTGEVKADKLVDFVGMLDAAPATTRAALGILDTTTLDIEGIAYKDGALYFGLKSPVDGDGSAVIWRATAPDKLLAGDLAGAKLAVWSKLKLTVEADGRKVPAGIADMVFWDSDTLVIAVTASGAEVKTEAGAIYVARATAGTLAPVHVRTFAGLKPEGITRGPKDTLAVVFDRGADAAQWLQLAADQLKAENAKP